MARKESGETKAPLVISLVFFVLTTIGLGVMTYLAYSDMAVVRAEQTKAVSEKKLFEDQSTKDKEIKQMYRVAIGVGTEEDRTNLQNLRNSDEVNKAYNEFMNALRNGVAGAVSNEANKFVGGGGQPFAMTMDNVFKWNWPQGGKLEAAPSKSLIDQIVAFYAAQQLGERQTATEKTKMAEAIASATTAKTQYEAQIAALRNELNQVPAKIAAEAKKYEDQATKTRTDLGGETAKYQAELKKKDDAIKDLNHELTKIKEDHAKAKDRIQIMEAELAVKEDPFAHDKPHGQIMRRRGNMVEINLGSADNVKSGLKFAVHASDTPQRGFTKDRNGTVQAKAKLEVIQTLGEHLSQARILEGSERDPIRDSVLNGDLIYNSVWRKGAPDHVALVGIFDLDGDGVDDIKRLVADLTRMGIVVDAYFDLDQRKWVGKISEKTIYSVEGNSPFKDIQPGEPPAVLDAKASLLKAIGDAQKEAKDRGSKSVRMRDFFPRVGYPLNLDVNERRINEAAARYLKTAAAGEAPATPAPPPPAKNDN